MSKPFNNPVDYTAIEAFIRPAEVLMADFSSADKEAYYRLYAAEERLSNHFTTMELEPEEEVRPSRRRLVLCHADDMPSDETLGRYLGAVDAARAEYGDVIAHYRDQFPNLGKRALNPPMIASAEGLVPWTAANAGALREAMQRPSNLVTWCGTDAYRSARMPPQAAWRMFDEEEGKLAVRQQIYNDKAQYERVRDVKNRRQEVERQRGKLARFENLMSGLGIKNWHMQIRSGQRNVYTARFENAPSFQFTLPSLTFLPVVADLDWVTEADKRDRKKAFVPVLHIGRMAIFLSQELAAREDVTAALEALANE